jgi:glycosyltransferase involved in cell wall biosynthesis
LGKINHRDIVPYYQSHHLFIHLSKTGSLDKTILEAMSCGMNVLSSSDASKSFLPQNSIFDDKNAEELANKIITLKNLEPSSNLREYVAHNHNLNNLINKIAKTINEQ